MYTLTTSGNVQCFEVDAGKSVHTVTFTTSGEHLVSGSENVVQVWRVKDGKHVATIPVDGRVDCVAASRDGTLIAGGTDKGEVLVWDAKTYDQVEIKFKPGDEDNPTNIRDIDFSPCSSRLVSANGPAGTAIVWDIVASQKVQTLEHGSSMISVDAAKYSPQGDRIATASRECVRVWDSSDGHFLVDVNVGANGLLGSCNLLWHDKHLFVKMPDCIIKEIDPAAGSIVSGWLVPDADVCSRIALLPLGNSIAYTANKSLTFWDITTHTRSSTISYTDNIYSIACSPDGQILAVATGEKVIVMDPSSNMFRSVSELELDVDSAAIDAWKDGQLSKAEALLSAKIPTSKMNAHHVLASRALVRTRLALWDTALVDAEESIEARPSIVGYIAMCVALVRNGETDKGCAMCDVALHRFSSVYVSLLLLIKAVALFMAGKHIDAISRIDDLITDGLVDPGLYAYMRLLLGNKYMENGDYELAIRSFEDAQTKLDNPSRQPPLIVSLISGWKFDNLAITIHQRLCEALLAADRTKETGDSLLR